MLSIGIVFLGVLSTLAAFCSGSRCFRDSDIESPYLLCYHTGKISLNETDVGNCTHLILTNVVTKNVPGNKLLLGEGISEDLSVLKEKNPNLVTIFTLNVGKNESTALLESTNKTKHLVEEISSFLQETTFDGLELNFEFTTETGGSKHSYTSFVKVLSKSLNYIHRRTRRSYEVVEKEEDEEDVTKRIETTSISGKAEEDEQDDDRGQENADKIDTTTDSETSKESGNGTENHEGDCENRTAWLVIRLPVKLDVIGKKYNLKALSRYADLLSVSTYNIVNDNVKDVTYHPSRLMGLSDIYNTDSILDFILGMGATKSRIVIGLPATAIGFHLKNSTKNTPGSPVVSKPTTFNQAELCSLFKKENWTLERDEDLTAPYAYAGSTWLAFEDEISVSIKGKYILLRELGGGAIYPIDDDVNDKKCTKRLKTSAYLTSVLASNFRNFGRKPRALVLESLQNEIHDRGYSSIEAGVKLSEYRIVRVVDHSGAVHVIRRNTKTQFECSRQGYFSHPLGCNRFYRCVKFDQYSDEFTVFEYNCPAGLAFDERWEVCVWPGSLPNGAPCTGSSEIAPVPRSHYQCPSQEGYYGDPENCRWFFACLDHARDGITPLTAYEFRCPFGLVFNQEKLACDWPWIVGSCGNTGGVGYLGLSSAVHTSTFLNGGNLEASYGQYGKNAEEASFSSFGRGFGSSLKNANGFSGAKGGQSGEAGIGYIASHFDGRDSNRAPFASYPDFEISGGRVHNKGGVILQENVNFGGFQGTSYGKTGGLDFSTQSYGRGSLNSFGGLPSGVSLTSKDESVGGLDISGYASGHGSANPLNSFSVSTADSESNLYKQSAEGSAFDAGSGLFKASQNEGLYKGSNRDGTSGSLFGKAYGYGASGIQQNIQLKSPENGGVYGDRSSNIRTPTSPSVDIAGISLSNQSPYSYIGSSLSDKSLHKTYQQAEGGSGSDRLLSGNLQQSSGVLKGELYTTSRDSNANTPAVTIGNSVTLPQSSYPNIKPVNPSTSTLLNTPAASFVSSTIEPISHVKVTDHLDIRGGTNFGDISYSLPHLKAATTPSPFATTVGSTATTEAQLFVPVKTERPEFQQASFGHNSKYTISSTVKPFAAVSSTASSVNTDEQSLRESSGTAFRDTAFGNSKNSFPTSAFGSYDNSVSGVSGSSYGKAFGTSYESQGSSGSFTSLGDIALSGDHSSTESSLGGRLSSHSFGKSLSNSNVEVTDGSKFSTGGIVYDKGTGKITGSATGGLSGGAGISPYVNSAGNIVLTSAQQGRFQTGSTALGESSLGSIGSSSLFNTYESKTAGDGLHQSFGAPALSDLGKSTAGSLSTAFGNSNQKSGSVYGSVTDFGSSNGYLLGKGFDKSILGTSSADGVPFNSFGGPTASSTNFGKTSDTVTVSQLAQSNAYGRTGTESSSDFLLKGSNAGTSDASVGSVFIGTSGVSSGDAHTGISGTFFDESHIGTSGASLGSSTLDSPSTSHKELSGGAFFGSSREKIIDSNKGYKIPHAYFPDASLEGGLVTSHKNLGIPSSEVSHGITTLSSTNSFDGTSGNPLSKTFEAPGETAFGTHLQGGTSFGPGINAFGQTSQDSFQHSVTGSSGASFGVSGGGSLNPFSSGSTFTNDVGASYGTKLVSSVANTFDASAPDSLPNRYEDFVKGSLEKTYGMPVIDSTLTSHGLLPSLFGTSGNAGITSYGGIQPNSEQSDVTFVPPGQTLKVTTPAKNKKPDFNLNVDYEKLNDNFITAPGLTSKPTVKPFESFYSGSKGGTFKTQVEHQNEEGNNFNSYSHLNLLKQTTTNSFGQTGSGKDANRPFDTLDISKQTYGEAIKFSNQGTNFEQSHALGNGPLLAANVNQSAGISHSKIIEHSLISNSFGSQHSGNSLGSSYFSTIQGGGQTFKIVVPNIQPSYALDTSEKFQHATDVMVEKQPIVQVAGIEPVGYDYKESFQETITSKGLSKGSGSFSYGGVKTVASQPNHVSTVTSAPAITTFAPLTYKHGHTTASTTPLHLRPDYLEPIIHNRTQLIRTKVLVPVVTTTTQLPTAQSKIHLTSPKASDVNLKPLLPTQVTYTSAQYSQHGETSSTSLYRDGGNFEKAEPEAQNVVEVTPKPVIYHGTFETIGNKHVVIQSEESSASNQDSLNNVEQQRTESNALGQKPGVYSYPSHFPGGTYYNEQLLENAKPTIQTTTKFLTTTEPYKSSLQTNTFSHQQLLPTLPSATSLPETTFYTNVHQSDFNQFELAQIKTNSRQHDGVLSHPSTNNQFHLPVVSQSPDTSSSKFKSKVPATEYRSPSTETTTSGLGLSQVNFKATSLGHQHPAATFDYSSNPLESYGKFFQQFNRSDSSFSLKDFGSSIRGTINPKIEISPPPKEYILNQQLGVQIGGDSEKAQVYSTNEGSDEVRGFAYASRGSAMFQDGINGKDSYQTTITGGRDAGQVPGLYKGRYGKVITDEAFGEKLSGLHYDVMKTNSKTPQKSKGRQYHGTLVSDIPATNKYEEYEIENQRQFENSVRNGASGPGRALTSNIDDSYEGKAKKTVFVSQTSDANPILVGKLAGQCSCQSNLLQVKETKKQSTGAEHKSNKQGNDASAILKYTEAPVTGTPYTKGSTLAGLDGHNVDYLPTGSPSFQPDEVVSIAQGISTKTKQFRGKARFLSPSPHLYYSGPDSSLSSPIWTSQITHGESGEESRTRNEIHDRFSKSRGGAAFDRYGPGGWRPFDETLQGSVDCKRPGLFRHPKYCNKFYACNYDPWEERFTLHIFNCPIRLTYDNSISACNWPVGGPACANDNLLV